MENEQSIPAPAPEPPEYKSALGDKFFCVGCVLVGGIYHSVWRQRFGRYAVAPPRRKLQFDALKWEEQPPHDLQPIPTIRDYKKGSRK